MIPDFFNSPTELNFKESIKKRVVVYIIIFALSLIFFSFQLFVPIRVFDEGIILTGAERVLNGEFPYKDFWSIYPPGNFFVLSFLFELFGTSVLTERIYGIVINACLSTSIFIILHKCRIRFAYILACYLLSLITIGSIKLSTYPVFPALLFINIAVIFFISYVDDRKSIYLVLSGVFITFSSLFRHELAGFACISFIISLIYFNYWGGAIISKKLLILLSSVFFTGLPFLLYLSYFIGIDNLYFYLIKTPAMVMPGF
jgi:hypothetical protein